VGAILIKFKFSIADFAGQGFRGRRCQWNYAVGVHGKFFVCLTLKRLNPLLEVPFFAVPRLG
jgi:hypothetical protein